MATLKVCDICGYTSDIKDANLAMIEIYDGTDRIIDDFEGYESCTTCRSTVKQFIIDRQREKQFVRDSKR